MDFELLLSNRFFSLNYENFHNYFKTYIFSKYQVIYQTGRLETPTMHIWVSDVKSIIDFLYIVFYILIIYNTFYLWIQKTYLATLPNKDI